MTTQDFALRSKVVFTTSIHHLYLLLCPRMWCKDIIPDDFTHSSSLNKMLGKHCLMVFRSWMRDCIQWSLGFIPFTVIRVYSHLNAYLMFDRDAGFSNAYIFFLLDNIVFHELRRQSNGTHSLHSYYYAKIPKVWPNKVYCTLILAKTDQLVDNTGN